MCWGGGMRCTSFSYSPGSAWVGGRTHARLGDTGDTHFAGLECVVELRHDDITRTLSPVVAAQAGGAVCR